MVATPNGEKSLAQIQSELQQAGYNGPWTNADMVAAYLRTAGGSVVPQNAAPQVFGATPQVAGQGGGDLAALAAAFNSSGALSQQQIANQKAQFDANLQFQKQQMEQIGLPQLVIQQRLADLQQQQFQYQMYLTQQQQGLAENQLGLQQSGLGLQALQAQAQLGGPSNWVQAYNLAQGLKQTDIPVFMQRLFTGQQTPSAVGGAGLSTPQSLQTLAAQAGVGGAGGVPGVTINGQPVGGGSMTSIGGAISPTLAPMPFLSQGGGGGVGAASFGGGGTAGALGAGVTRQDYAAGPNSPNDTAPGSLIPGTTGEFGGATQNFSNSGPGSGSFSLSGTRGTNMTGYDPATGQLKFDWNFLENKPRAVFGLYDQTTGQAIGSGKPTDIIGSTPGDPNGQGWMSQPYVSGSQGTSIYDTGGAHIDPTHMYRLRIALPMEGGGAPAMERDVSGATILGLQNHNAATTPAAGTTNVTSQVSAPAPTSPGIGAGSGAGSVSTPYAINGRIVTETRRPDGGVSLNDMGAAPSGTADYTPMPQSAPAAGAAPTAAPTAPTGTGPNMSGVYNLGSALFAAGGGALGPQALEGLGSTGTSMLQSVGQAVGGDWNTFLNQYLRSRVGQGAAQAG